eukprot:GFUD01085656.1.p1 GENE.GFUD01085656.1~~GFUD01085656.1.p1  ORF type:complete len:138 (+),score=22.86 GFUD01085656.1:66-479(+)
MASLSALLSVLTISLLFRLGDGIRCYVCRSDELPDCGDPFNPGRVPSSECDNFFTQQTFTCFKATQYAAGQYVTVRGCAPFTTDVFPGGMQKGMVGSYWKGVNVMSLCDFPNCNGAVSNKVGWLGCFALTVALLRLF